MSEESRKIRKIGEEELKGVSGGAQAVAVALPRPCSECGGLVFLQANGTYLCSGCGGRY